MRILFYTVLMGMLGAGSRYLIGLLFGSPLSTLTVNFLGCFLLAMVFDYFETRWPKDLVGAVGTGFIGAFTTFSAFSTETVNLFIGGDYIFAVAYMGLSLLGGLAFALLGLQTAKAMETRAKTKDKGVRQT